VCAVIAAWNGAAWIAGALESLRASGAPVLPIVVDNASTDATRGIIREGYPDVLLIELPENRGFGAATNTGIRHALRRGADAVLLLNQDARVFPDTVGRLADALFSRDDIGIVSPLHLTGDGTALAPVFATFLSDNPRLASDGLLGRLAPLYDIAFVNAAVWLVRRQVFERVGGFDPVFFMYGEDNDYCARTLFHGFRICVVPAAHACHAPAGIPGRTEPFSKTCMRATAQIVHHLKRPGHRFVLSCLSAALVVAKRSVVQLMNGELRNLTASAIGVCRAYARLPEIFRHYRRCRIPGPVWLED